MKNLELVKNTFKSKNVLQYVEKFINNTLVSDETLSDKEQITKALHKLCDLFDKDEKSRKYVCHLVICFNAFDAQNIIEMLAENKFIKFVELGATKKSAILNEDVETYVACEKSDSVVTAREISAIIFFAGLLNRENVSEIVKIFETHEEIQHKRRIKQLEYENKKREERESKPEYENKHHEVLRKPTNQKIVQNMDEKTFDKLTALKDKLEQVESN